MSLLAKSPGVEAEAEAFFQAQLEELRARFHGDATKPSKPGKLRVISCVRHVSSLSLRGNELVLTLDASPVTVLLVPADGSEPICYRFPCQAHGGAPRS